MKINFEKESPVLGELKEIKRLEQRAIDKIKEFSNLNIENHIMLDKSKSDLLKIIDSIYDNIKNKKEKINNLISKN